MSEDINQKYILELELDPKVAANGAKVVSSSLDNIGRSADKANEAMKKMENAYGVFKKLGETLDNTKRIFNSVNSAFESFTLGVGSAVGITSAIKHMDDYSKSILSVGSQFSKYGIGAAQFEKHIIDVGKATNLTREETMRLFSSYEKGFPLATIRGAEQLFKNIKNVVGSNASAIQDMSGNLSGLASQYPQLQASIERLNEVDKKRLNSVTEMMLLTGRMNLSQVKGLQDYINQNKQVTEEDEKRKKQAEEQIAATQKIKKSFEDITISLGTALLPTYQKIADITKTIAPYISSFTDKFGTWLVPLILAKSALGNIFGLLKMGAGTVGAIFSGGKILGNILGKGTATGGEPRSPLDMLNKDKVQKVYVVNMDESGSGSSDASSGGKLKRGAKGGRFRRMGAGLKRAYRTGGIKGLTKGAFKGIGRGVSGAFKGIGRGVSGASSFIKGGMGGLLGSGLGGLKLASVAGIGGFAADYFSDKLKESGNKRAAGGVGAIGDISTVLGVAGVFGPVGAIGVALYKLPNIIRNLGDLVGGKVGEAISSFGDFLGKKATEVSDIFIGGFSAIGDSISSSYRRLKKDMIKAEEYKKDAEFRNSLALQRVAGVTFNTSMTNYLKKQDLKGADEFYEMSKEAQLNKRLKSGDIEGVMRDEQNKKESLSKKREDLEVLRARAFERSKEEIGGQNLSKNIAARTQTIGKLEAQKQEAINRGDKQEVIDSITKLIQENQEIINNAKVKRDALRRKSYEEAKKTVSGVESEAGELAKSKNITIDKAREEILAKENMDLEVYKMMQASIYESNNKTKAQQEEISSLEKDINYSVEQRLNLINTLNMQYEKQKQLSEAIKARATTEIQTGVQMKGVGSVDFEKNRNDIKKSYEERLSLGTRSLSILESSEKAIRETGKANSEKDLQEKKDKAIKAYNDEIKDKENLLKSTTSEEDKKKISESISKTRDKIEVTKKASLGDFNEQQEIALQDTIISKEQIRTDILTTRRNMIIETANLEANAYQQSYAAYKELSDTQNQSLSTLMKMQQITGKISPEEAETVYKRLLSGLNQELDMATKEVEKRKEALNTLKAGGVAGTDLVAAEKDLESATLRVVEAENKKKEAALYVSNMYKGQKDLVSEQLSYTKGLIDLYDSFASGVSASVEMRQQAFNQLGEQKVLAQKELVLLEQKIKEEQANGKDTLLLETERAKKNNEILNLTKQQADITKSLRDGWISAISASMIGTGRIAKFAIDSKTNAGLALQYIGGTVTSMTSGAVGRGGAKTGEQFTTQYGGISGSGGGYMPDVGSLSSEDEKNLRKQIKSGNIGAAGNILTGATEAANRRVTSFQAQSFEKGGSQGLYKGKIIGEATQGVNVIGGDEINKEIQKNMPSSSSSTSSGKPTQLSFTLYVDPSKMDKLGSEVTNIISKVIAGTPISPVA